MNDFDEFVKNDISDTYTKKILIYDLFLNVLTKPSTDFKQNISKYKTSIYNRYKTKYGTEDNCYFNELSSYIGIINELNDNLKHNDFDNIDHDNFITNFNNLYDLSEMTINFTNVSQSNEFVSFMEKFNFPLILIFDNIKHNFDSNEDTLLHLINKLVQKIRMFKITTDEIEQINYIIQNNLDIIINFKSKIKSYEKNKFIDGEHIFYLNDKYIYAKIYFKCLLKNDLTSIYEIIDMDTPNILIKVLYEKYKKYIKINDIKSRMKSRIESIILFPGLHIITMYKLYNKINLINELMPELLDYIIEIISLLISDDILKEKFQIPEIEFYIKYIKNENKINNK